MGAWGYKPFENDSALDWLGSAVEPGILKAITTALQRVTKDKTRRAESYYYDAIGAAELLVTLSGRKQAIDLSYSALKCKTYLLAAFAIEKIKGSDFASEWDQPARMTAQLDALLRRLAATSRRQRKIEAEVAVVRVKRVGQRKKKAA